jgi:hypothetical protein
MPPESTAPAPWLRHPVQSFRIALSAILAICCLLYVFFSRHWPLLGDASLVHYLVLLMRHGMAPYRTIVDAQMPGTYLLDWLVIHAFGGGAVGMRVFDLTLCALAGLAMLSIAWPRDRFAGFCAAALLALLHGRDGIPQTAQRDLIIAVLMLLACASMFQAVRRNRPPWMLAFGFCSALAATIKPTAAPLAFLLVLAIAVLRRRGQPWRACLAWGLLGLAVPLAAVLAFLLREQAMPQFFDALHGMWPYYARLANRPLSYLLLHSLSPLLPMVLVWVVVLIARRFEPCLRHRSFDWERCALWLGLALGLLSYLSQGKGFPYHRYPMLGFLLLLMALDLSAALGSDGERPPAMRGPGLLRICGVIGLAVGALVIAPLSTYKISTYNWRQDELFDMLRNDLDQLGGASLSGHVQCLDSFSGCINALYRLNLAESTGFLVDFYFWAPQQTPVTEQMRQRFWEAIHRNPPRVFVVMKQDFPSDTPTYDKLSRWPDFARYLHDHYTLAADRMGREWVRRESRPYPPVGYRIYVQNLPAASQP